MAKLEDVIQRGTAAAKPAATAVAVGTLYYVTDTNELQRSNGASWESVEGAGGSGGTTYSSAYASRPAAGTAGNLFLPNDGYVVERDSGTAWVPWGPLFPFTAPVSGDFSWVNQGSATVSTTNGGVYLFAPAVSGENLKIRIKSAPSTPYTITAAFIHTRFYGTGNWAGLCFRESSTGLLHTFGFTGNLSLYSSKFPGPTSSPTHYTNWGITGSTPLFLRIQDDGTNRICSASHDGQNFMTMHTVTRLDYLTGGADQVGFFVNTNNATLGTGMNLLSWKQS